MRIQKLLLQAKIKTFSKYIFFQRIMEIINHNYLFSSNKQVNEVCEVGARSETCIMLFFHFIFNQNPIQNFRTSFLSSPPISTKYGYS